MILQILLETGLFEHTPTEVDLWLDNLVTLEPSNQQEVVTFLQSCLTTSIRNPYPYNDRVADCVASAQSSRQQHLHGNKVDDKSFDMEGGYLYKAGWSRGEMSSVYCLVLKLKVNQPVKVEQDVSYPQSSYKSVRLG